MRRIILAAILFVCILGTTAVYHPTLVRAQRDLPQRDLRDDFPPPNPVIQDEAKVMRRVQRKQEEERNKQRYEEIKRDTEKLLQLATELKTCVDKSNEDVISLDVIKKAAEIQRLSKKIQQKMQPE